VESNDDKLTSKLLEKCLENHYKKEEQKDQTIEDIINHPNHYTYSKVECIDAIENMPFKEACAIKYVWRHRYKNGAEDLKKAIWYIKRILKQEYNYEER
jgi:hypothetical protein